MIKFNENDRYKLTKIGVKDFDKKRIVQPGDTFIGNLSFSNDNCILITRGFEYLRTTSVVNIQDQENGNYLIETSNSFYSLEKVTNENNSGTTTT